MQTLTHPFEDLEVARAWPVFVTCSGEVEIIYADDEWSIGDVTVNWFRGGEWVETVTYPAMDDKRDEHPRAERIRQLILNDSIRCAGIDEIITETTASRRDLADDARYDDPRQSAL